MGLADRFKGVAAKLQETAAAVQQINDEAASARAEWGDGGTARPGWSSQMAQATVGIGGGLGHDVAIGPGAVPLDELAQLHAWTEHLRQVLFTGAAGIATVHGVRDTGRRLARHAFVELDVTLRPDGAAAEHPLTVQLPVCGTGLRGWDERTARPVRFDPADPSRMAFVWQGKRRSNLHRGHVKVKGFHGQRIDLVGLLPGRAIVDGVSDMLAPGEVSNTIEVDLHLRLREPGGGLGPRVACGHVMDWKPVKLLAHAMDVPVAVDPVSGELEDVVVAALTEELRPRFGELSAADQLFVEPLRVVGRQVRDVAGLARDVTSKEFWEQPKLADDGGFLPGDPILAPAHGVTFEQWVAVSAGQMAAPETWAPGLREWRRRQMGHPMMAQKFGMAVERARKGR